ncbi:Putative retroelement [Phytophthora palmivora]|uniref:Retroelement n=1 Tax=Phytophthora palmivora TaxID=4796 RepID=A0A2P4YD82_9STRA|nr:Putative retroelement [Phytophthora palmivora]
MNSHTIRRTLPMPRKDVIFEKMLGCYFFSCMDLLSEYYQFLMRDSDIKLTAFQTPDGLYEYLVIPMGLSNAPATFNSGIRKILADLDTICQSYFDDIYIFTRGKDIHDHLVALDKSTTNSIVSSVHQKSRVLEITLVVQESELTQPNRFAHDASPLFELLKTKARSTVLKWSPELQEHFQNLKAQISATPVLDIPEFSKPFHVRMDASDFAVGGVLFQMEVRDDVEIERPIPFNGRKYKDAEKNYPIREKELLAVIFALRVWRVYLLDRPFIVETDHKSLESVLKQKSISRRIARWYTELSEYPIQFKYISGASNSVTDGIS